ncbi:MAG: aspartate/glutamate racemase family protein [Deltaproteobacteria bacterium]|nr:aspartate/glutamate racemase family protein [Deltaproteobacteria bacterium]
MTGASTEATGFVLPRAKLGVVVLSTNLTVEDEFRRMMPADISYYVARCVIPDASTSDREKEAELLALEKNLGAAARSVAMTRPELILFACTIGSMLGGAGYDLAVSERIARATGIPALTTGTAVVEALRSLGLRRLTVVSPYPEALGVVEKGHLEASVPGLSVLSMKHLGVVGSYEKNLLPASLAAGTAKEALVAGCDGLFVSCTAWPTLQVIEPLERELGLPVITSTQASLWACLRRCGIRDRLPFGRLFAA